MGYIAETFNNLTSMNGLMGTGNVNYAFRNERDQAIVPADIYVGYRDFMENGNLSHDRYTFALFMMGEANGGADWDDQEAVRDAENSAYEDYVTKNGDDCSLAKKHQAILLHRHPQLQQDKQHDRQRQLQPDGYKPR